MGEEAGGKKSVRIFTRLGQETAGIVEERESAIKGVAGLAGLARSIGKGVSAGDEPGVDLPAVAAVGAGASCSLIPVPVTGIQPNQVRGVKEISGAADAPPPEHCDDHRNEGGSGDVLPCGDPPSSGDGITTESANPDPYAGFQIGHLRDWDVKGRDEQKPPTGDWRTWLVMGGRGSGKTRAGAEWVHKLASQGSRSDLRIALVAETLGDAREVMIDGVSGICRIARKKFPDFEISRRRLVWPNGAVAQIFSSEDPEALRGPQFHYAWCDEIGKWKHAEETFDMLQFGLRLGYDPRQLVTTTPRSVPVLKRLIADPSTRLVRIATGDNRENLAPGFIEALERRYGGTRLGRQELAGELIDDREDALWRRGEIEACVIRGVPALRRIVVAVDPPSGIGQNSCCGIVVAGLEPTGRAVVLADCSVEGATPATWAGAVVKAYRRFAADRVVAEVNQGGEMVTAMLRSVEAALPIAMVRATRGKFLRAEPVAALYEQGRVAHAGRFIELEDQMCDFGPDGLSSGRSPDRLDALVWALTALVLEGQGEPRVRGI